MSTWHPLSVRASPSSTWGQLHSYHLPQSPRAMAQKGAGTVECLTEVAMVEVAREGPWCFLRHQDPHL